MSKRKCEVYNSDRFKWVIVNFTTIKKGDRFRLFDSTLNGFKPVIDKEGLFEFIALEDAIPFKGDEENYSVNCDSTESLKGWITKGEICQK